LAKKWVFIFYFYSSNLNLLIKNLNT
jgi:hypothetical protein